MGIEIADMEESVELVDLEKQDFITLPTNITKEQAEQIKNLNLKPVIVKEEFKREYFESDFFPHIGICRSGWR